MNRKTFILELTSTCNCKCLGCTPSPIITNKSEYLTIDMVKRIFNKENIKQINKIFLSGCFSEPTLNPDLIKIVDYLLTIKPSLNIILSTNGSTRNTKFWSELKQYNITVWWCLDGLEDTNHIYRVGASWNKIMSNFQSFNNGKNCVWKFIEFDWNKHQIEKAKEISYNLGFAEFEYTKDRKNDKLLTLFDKASKIKINPNKHSCRFAYVINQQGLFFPCNKLYTSYQVTRDNEWVIKFIDEIKSFLNATQWSYIDILHNIDFHEIYENHNDCKLCVNYIYKLWENMRFTEG